MFDDDICRCCYSDCQRFDDCYRGKGYYIEKKELPTVFSISNFGNTCNEENGYPYFIAPEPPVTQKEDTPPSQEFLDALRLILCEAIPIAEDTESVELLDVIDEVKQLHRFFQMPVSDVRGTTYILYCGNCDRIGYIDYLVSLVDSAKQKTDNFTAAVRLNKVIAMLNLARESIRHRKPENNTSELATLLSRSLALIDSARYKARLSDTSIDHLLNKVRRDITLAKDIVENSL